MARTKFSACSIVVSGATSGLGRALALEFAAPGVVLHLLGRDRARLDSVSAAATALGATVRMAAIDVRDGAAMRDFLQAGDAQAPVDCIIVNAGITAGTSTSGASEDIAAAYALIDVNLIGALNTLAPLVPALRHRRRGVVGVVSSLAAFAPQANGAAYGATKAALLAYALAARDAWRRDGVSVSAICPGFIDTPMTERYVGWKPLMMSSEEAARRVRRGLERDLAIIAFPQPLYLAARLQQALPQSFRRWSLSAFRHAVRDEQI